MSKKQTIRPEETIVLDDATIEELDDASLTSVMRDITDSIRRIEVEDEKLSSGDEDGADGADDHGLGYLVPEDGDF